MKPGYGRRLLHPKNARHCTAATKVAGYTATELISLFTTALMLSSYLFFRSCLNPQLGQLGENGDT